MLPSSSSNNIYREAIDSSNRVYYYNINTRQSVWVLPKDAYLVPKEVPKEVTKEVIIIKENPKEEFKYEKRSSLSVSTNVNNDNSRERSSSIGHLGIIKTPKNLAHDSNMSSPTRHVRNKKSFGNQSGFVSLNNSPSHGQPLRSPGNHVRRESLSRKGMLSEDPYKYIASPEDRDKERKSVNFSSKPPIASKNSSRNSFSNGFSPQLINTGTNPNTPLIPFEWIECKEVKSGRSLWYHTGNFHIVFDKHPSNSEFDKFSSAAPSPFSSKLGSPTGKSESIPPAALTLQPIDPEWEQNDDGTWYNTKTFESRIADDPPCVNGVLNIVEYVEEKVLYNDTPESATAKLLNAEMLQWDMYNPRCELYRAYSSRVDHSEFTPQLQSLTCPRYFSNLPLPSTYTNNINITVFIPDPYMNPKSFCHVARIVLTDNDTGINALEAVLKKSREDLILTDFVLKVVGKNEYIYGDTLVSDFECVRMCIRQQNDILLELVHSPHRDIPNWPISWSAPSYYDDIYLGTDLMEVEQNEYVSLKCGMIKPDEPDAFENWTFIPFRECFWNFRVRIQECVNLNKLPRWNFTFSEIYIKAMLFHGNLLLKGTVLSTRPCKITDNPVFLQWLGLPNLKFGDLPRETRIAFLIYGISNDKSQSHTFLAHVSQKLIDERGCLIEGSQNLKLWPLAPKDDKNPNRRDDILTYIPESPFWDNLSGDDSAPQLCVQFDTFQLAVVAPILPSPIAINEHIVGGRVDVSQISKPTRNNLDNIFNADPLYSFTDEEKTLLWIHRHLYVGVPLMLPKFLLCVDWTDPMRQAEAHRLISIWSPLDPYSALQLLDIRYPDTLVRQYAVHCLCSLADSELVDILLQLVQILKFEPYHTSFLSQFLLERCIRNPYQVGHYFFWHLKAEMNNIEFLERYTLIMEEYLKHSGHHAVELQVQAEILFKLQIIAEAITKNKIVSKMPSDQNKSALHKLLRDLNKELPSRFQVPLNPRWVVKGIKAEKCKFMSSKKVPLWLVFENADPNGPDIYAMFKSGDDLRQDILTLELIRMMDRIWLSNNLDLRLKPYSVIATGVNREGEGVGMIEIVLKSTTISDIQIEFGGGAAGALDKTTLHSYVKKSNDPNSPYFNEAISNFKRSCAGYCVATFVLGIADRHNGNIMLTQSGHLFHIDFGHFLGNFKEKLGFKRERSPFVFTPEMAYVIRGGESAANSRAYNEFRELCCEAYNTLRKNSSLFITLFILMQTAGMPELQRFEDIYYLRDMLRLQLSEGEAATSFKEEIDSSLNENWRVIDNMIHNWMHGKKN